MAMRREIQGKNFLGRGDSLQREGSEVETNLVCSPEEMRMLREWNSGTEDIKRWKRYMWSKSWSASKIVLINLDSIVSVMGNHVTFKQVINHIQGASQVVQWERIYLQWRRPRFNPWVRKIPWRRNSNLLQYSCLENPMDGGAWWASPWGCKESDTTEAT